MEVKKKQIAKHQVEPQNKSGVGQEEKYELMKKYKGIYTNKPLKMNTNRHL